MKVKCPTCKKWNEWQNNPFRPFCSERCKLTDLGLWASGEYRIESQKFSEETQTNTDDTSHD